jgi:hypothetical protein
LRNSVAHQFQEARIDNLARFKLRPSARRAIIQVNHLRPAALARIRLAFPQDRGKLSILASTDEMSNHSLSISASCVRMLKAFIEMSLSRPASDSPVHSIRRLLLVSIACDQSRDSD